jgi:hypothetical protein
MSRIWLFVTYAVAVVLGSCGPRVHYSSPDRCHNAELERTMLTPLDISAEAMWKLLGKTEQDTQKAFPAYSQRTQMV